MHQQDREKEQELYTFTPKLNDDYRVETETAENVIVNSNSFTNYVDRVRKGILSKSKEKTKLAPGSGNIWKNQLTSPKKHILYSDKNSDTSLNVKSLKKVRIFII